MALSGTIRSSASFTNTLSGIDLSTPTESVSKTASASISTGVLYHDTYSLSNGETYTINIGNNSLSDVFGNTLAITTLTGLMIIADSTNTVDITPTTSANGIFNTLPALSAGESFCWIGSIDTTTNAEISLVNGAAGGIVTIIVTGTEA